MRKPVNALIPSDPVFHTRRKLLENSKTRVENALNNFILTMLNMNRGQFLGFHTKIVKTELYY